MSAPTERDLQRLFDRSPIGMYRSTQSGQLEYANAALVKLLGFPDLATLLATNVNEIYVDARDRTRLVETYRAHGVLDGVRAHWKMRDGRRLVVQLYGHIVSDDRGEVSFDASVVDVTAAEAQRAELERTAHTLELVLRQASAVYWLCDRDLQIVGGGGATQEVFGFGPGYWLGHSIPEVHETAEAAADAVESHTRALAGETLLLTREFLGKQLATTIAPWRRDGEIVGVIGTSIDVTATRALERRMVDAQRAESLGVLAGGLAHDFNNLLVAILGNADLGLRETVPGAPGRAALENIRHASLRAAELTDQLLAYAGRGGVATTRVPTRPLVEELLRISAATMPDNVRVALEILPDVTIRGDAGQVRQVFLNLIGNAREALGARGGLIGIGAGVHVHDGAAHADDVITAPAGTYVRVAVEDDGPGISPQTRRRIFEPFFTTKASGHGLGLAAVLGIVRAHGGGLRVRSEPGRGACFEVLWPAAATPVQVPVVAAPVARTVLVIDDEDLVRDVVARMVEDLGYAAVTAADGAAGIHAVQQQVIDAVLVDLTMPRMNGAAVVAALRAEKPAMPIVLCTGHDRDRHGPVTADAYLPKPFRLEALEATLAKLLR